TLSEYGSVSRGVCEIDYDNNLISIDERVKIYKENDHIIYEDNDGSKHEIPHDARASMNFWCFTPSVFSFIKERFKQYLEKNLHNPKAEFLIPNVADEFIKSKQGVIKVIPTSAPWFGVTYKQDAPIVVEKLRQLISDGQYPAKLWG
ncbi:MAG: nucleotidyltransferase, partial [Chitinophagaceae bacterium]|nr:nucleotidyltransferase [Chitinophagaceae bacterium]